jgi:hypothetical protein
VPDYEFLFVVDLSRDPRYDKMLGDLVRSILGYVGFDRSVVASVVRDVCGAVTRAADPGTRCQLRFRAAGGEMNVSIGAGSAADWQITRPLPAG